MTENQIQKFLDRELGFFLRFYLAHDQKRARKLDELVSLIGHCAAHRLPFRYPELCDRVKKAIDDNPEEYAYSDPYVWLQNDTAIATETNAIASTTSSLRSTKAAKATRGTSRWPTPEYKELVASFELACEKGLEKHAEFAAGFRERLGEPSSSRAHGSYSNATMFLLDLFDEPVQAEFGLKSQSHVANILKAGDKVYRANWAESQRMAS
jgi:hypothetical protein